jgi:hypothetical protein
LQRIALAIRVEAGDLLRYPSAHRPLARVGDNETQLAQAPVRAAADASSSSSRLAPPSDFSICNALLCNARYKPKGKGRDLQITSPHSASGEAEGCGKGCAGVFRRIFSWRHGERVLPIFIGRGAPFFRFCTMLPLDVREAPLNSSAWRKSKIEIVADLPYGCPTIFRFGNETNIVAIVMDDRNRAQVAGAPPPHPS